MLWLRRFRLVGVAACVHLRSSTIIMAAILIDNATHNRLPYMDLADFCDKQGFNSAIVWRPWWTAQGQMFIINMFCVVNARYVLLCPVQSRSQINSDFC